MNDTLKKWLLYTLCGLVPLWMVDTVVLPRLGLGVLPVLLPLCVVAAAVLEGAFFGAQFGLVTGLLWASAYAAGIPLRIPILTLIGMLAGVVSQYALRRSMSGCLVCAAGAMAALEVIQVLGGLITALAPLEALTLLALREWCASMLCAPLVYGGVYFLYRKAGGKPV